MANNGKAASLNGHQTLMSIPTMASQTQLVPSIVSEASLFPVTVIILTHNEEGNISQCLKHLNWAEDIVIVDSGSNDATLKVAKDARKDIRIFGHPFQDFGEQRNWALSNSSPRHSWILFLDADEHCNPACAEAIRKAVTAPRDCVGFYLTCRNYFLGRWIKHCTLYPSWQLRLLKIGEVSYIKEGHGQREATNGKLGYISEPYDHYGFSKGISDWIDRHNKYSTEELELISHLRRQPLRLTDLVLRGPLARRRCLKRLAAQCGCRPLFRFLYLYFIRRGFLDGRAGFLFCLLRVSHEIHITVKLHEQRLATQQSRNESHPINPKMKNANLSDIAEIKVPS